MKRYLLPLALVLTLMLSSTAGCLGLIQAREGLEQMRGEATSSISVDSISISHVFDTIDIEPYTNSSTIEVSAESTQVVIYRKVTLIGTDVISCSDGGLSRYVKATLIDSNGDVQWELDECEDVQPITITITPPPALAVGEWELLVEARGVGIPGTAAQDTFTVTVSVTNTCIVYPPSDTCE
ncbi:MAG: hypothetical protein ACJZ40_01430 [Candidatus Poseidoniaceae archaeon]